MPTTRVTTFASLVEGYQHTDPKLYQILQGFIQSIGEIQAELAPVVARVITGPGTIADTPTAPTVIAYEILQKLVLRIYWTGATNAATYEIRKGTVWETATFVTSVNQLEVRLAPIPTGNHVYLVRSRNGIGVYSATYLAVTITIPAIGAIQISASTVDNNVLLRYSEPDSVWQIDYYDVYRNNQLIGSIDSTFFVWFETVAGSFTYAVECVDIAGNRSNRASVTVQVKQPPDFELQDARHSLLAGYRDNALIYGDVILGWDYTDEQGWATQDYVWLGSNTGKLLVCVDDAEYWDEHFLDHTWDQPIDQMAVGYPIYIQPGALNAIYQEVIDYGGVFSNVILNLGWTLEQLMTTGTVSVVSWIEFSLNGTTWTTAVQGPSAFAASFRYARLTFNFTDDNDKALALFYNLVILLDVKRETDSGVVNALATDAGGTLVYFAKPFKDVDSITVTPTKQPEPLSAMYDFVDIPNPTEFKVLVYDSIGTRVSCVVSWKARGVV